MGPAYYNILKYQRSLFLHEGGSPAFIAARQHAWEREFFLGQALPGFLVGPHSIASHQAVRWSSLRLVPSL